MARQRMVVETVTCDLCGSETAEATTVTLGWGKDQWELDLCAKDNSAVSKTFDAWTQRALKVSARGRRAPKAGSITGDTTAIREWARANKMKVGEKGRIAAEIREAYAAANE